MYFHKRPTAGGI